MAEEPLSKRGALSAQLAKLRRGLRYRRDRGLTFSKHALLSLEKRVQPFERGLMRVTEPQAFALRQRAFKRDPGNMMAARDCVDSPLLFKGAWLDGKALAQEEGRAAFRRVFNRIRTLHDRESAQWEGLQAHTLAAKRSTRRKGRRGG